MEGERITLGVRKMWSHRKPVGNYMHEMKTRGVSRKALPIGYNSIYHIDAQTCSLMNGCKTPYPRCSSPEVQASSDLT